MCFSKQIWCTFDTQVLCRFLIWILFYQVSFVSAAGKSVLWPRNYYFLKSIKLLLSINNGDILSKKAPPCVQVSDVFVQVWAMMTGPGDNREAQKAEPKYYLHPSCTGKCRPRPPASMDQYEDSHWPRSQPPAPDYLWPSNCPSHELWLYKVQKLCLILTISL